MSAFGQRPATDRSEVDRLVREAIDRSELGVLLRSLAGRVGALEESALGARVFHSVDTSIPNAVTTVVPAFDSERFDRGGFHDAANPGRLTAPEAGLYAMGLSLQFASNAVGYRFGSIRVNGGGDVAADSRPAASGVPTWITLSTVWEMEEGDYIEARVLQTSGGALNVQASPARSMEFWIVRLGV